MKTRKWLVVASLVLALVAFLAVGSLGFAGCSSGTTPSAAPGEYKAITMVAGSMGSSVQAMEIGMSRVLNKYYPEIAWGVRTGISDTNVDGVTSGKMVMAYAGQVSYINVFGAGKDAQSRLRAIAMNTISSNIVIANKDAAFDNLRDIPKGTSLCGSTPGSSDTVAMGLYLKALGLSKTDFNYRELGKAELAEAWRNETVKVALTAGQMPSPLLTELASSKQGYKVLKVTEADLKPIAAEAQSRGFRIGELPLVGYAPQQFSFNTWGLDAPFFIMVRDDFPADIAYKMVKVLDEHQADLVAANPLCKNITPQMLIKYAGGAYPLHPGVEKYFKEKGYLK